MAIWDELVRQVELDELARQLRAAKPTVEVGSARGQTKQTEPAKAVKP